MVALFDGVVSAVFRRQWDDSFEVLADGVLGAVLVVDGVLTVALEWACEVAASSLVSECESRWSWSSWGDDWVRVVGMFSLEWVNESCWG